MSHLRQDHPYDSNPPKDQMVVAASQSHRSASDHLFTISRSRRVEEEKEESGDKR